MENYHSKIQILLRTPVGIATRDPEHMQISLLLVGTVSAPATDSDWNVETTSLRINGTGTVVYARSSPSCEEVDRIAVVYAGQHYFTFFLKSTQAKGRQDVALFLAMLQSFVYVG